MPNEYQLVMTQGPQPGQTFPLGKDAITLGRDPRNDIVIDHPQVSRRHARITRRGELMVIEDVGSTNGTLVNGTQLTGPYTLARGDVIGLGEVVMLTFYSIDTSAKETAVGRPTPVPLLRSRGAPPPTRQQALSPPPSWYEAPPPRPMQPPGYAAAPSSQPVYPPPLSATGPQRQEDKDKTWLWVGCGCLVLLVLAVCVAVFVLDYLRLLPPIFYEPLRWLGLI